MTSIKPEITLSPEAYQEIQAYVDLCDKEISGLGSVVFDPFTNSYFVSKVYLLDQEVGPAHTDLDDQAVAKLLYQHSISGEEGELHFWWHSHVNMGTFWSSTDHDTMDAIGNNGICIAAVFNKKGDKKGAIVLNQKDSPHIKFDDVKINIAHPILVDYDFIKSEIKGKVREPKKKTTLLGNTTGAFWDKDLKAYVDIHGEPIDLSVDKKKGWEEIYDVTKADDGSQMLYVNSSSLRDLCIKEWNSMSNAERGQFKSFSEYLTIAEEDYYTSFN